MEGSVELIKSGRVVRMRNRLWRIDNVLDGEFTATPIDGRDTYPRRFLSDIEELAEGSLPLPDPARTSDPAEQDLLLRAFRLSLVHGSAPLVGLQRSRAIPTPYQLVPLLLAVGRERVRLLIADDIGVGKTIEMGLVIAELVARGLVRRALFVVPANLREQTRDALSHFFHIDATIVAGHLLKGLERQLMPGQSVWHAHPFVVVSIDYAKRNAGKILDAKWDLVVFDEAHLCARPHVALGSRGGADQQRHKFAAKAARAIPHLVMMTATPHNGFSDSFASLIQLLDVDAVVWGGGDGRIPKIDRARAADHIVQRRRQDIRKWFEETGEPFPFPQRDQAERIVSLAQQEEAVLDELRTYTNELARKSAAVINQWVALHLQKRALSSVAALRHSIDNRIAALRKKVGDEAGSESDAEIAVMDAEGGDDLTDEQRSDRVDRSALGDADETSALERVKALTTKVTRKHDSKYRELVTQIALAYGRQKNKRVIVFTKYKDTLDYLVDNLRRDAKDTGRVAGSEVFAIFGEMNAKDRRDEFIRFESAAPSMLVATDVISEGMNLQRACAALIHYELPWNPNRLEQRNGRIDRYRQPEASVTIRTLVYDDPLDITIFRVLVEKAQEIRKEYGFAPPFFSSSRDLVELMRLYGRSPVEQLDLFTSAVGIERDAPLDAVGLSKEAVDRIKSDSFYGHQTVTLDEVQRAVAKTHRAVGTPEEVHRFVLAAFARFACPVRNLDQDRFEVRVETNTDLADLAGPNGALRATFDPTVGQDDPSVDVLDLAHPVVRRLIDLVRDEGIGDMDTLQRGRVSGYAHPAASEVIAVLHVLARYVTDSTPPVLLEELIPVAFPVWSDDPSLLRGPALEAILGAERAPGSMTHLDLVEAATRALMNAESQALIEKALEVRRLELARVGDQLSEAAGEWAAGMGELQLASQDLLTISIAEPP